MNFCQYLQSHSKLFWKTKVTASGDVIFDLLALALLRSKDSCLCFLQSYKAQHTHTVRKVFDVQCLLRHFSQSVAKFNHSTCLSVAVFSSVIEIFKVIIERQSKPSAVDIFSENFVEKFLSISLFQYQYMLTQIF
jgi:hypothetical protein